MNKYNENKQEISRRGLLKTFLASGISKTLISSSPLVSGIFFARHADAQGTGPNKSLVIYVPGGSIHDFWAPTGLGADMTLPAMSSSYEEVKTEFNFLLNMSHDNAGHGRLPRILSNSWSGSNIDTYDVYMGKQLGPNMPFTYVNLGVHSNGHGYLTRDGNTTIPFEDNPFNAFKLLFGSNVGGSPKTPIMDAHNQAANAIKSKLAGYEIDRLDEHLDAISDTQRRLDELSGGSNGQANYPYYTEMRNHLGSLSAYAIRWLWEEGILDNTVVVETTDMGNADIHSSNDVPLMIAGGGSSINRGVATTAGSGYNQLDALYTAAQACGVTLSFGKEIPGVLV